MDPNITDQFAYAVLWFQNWNKEERQIFGKFLLEHEQKSLTPLPSMVAHTLSNSSHKAIISNTVPILTRTLDNLSLHSNQAQNTADTPNTLSNTMNQLTLNPYQMYPELNEDDLSLFNCQMKIFMKWYPNWTASQKSEFANQINMIDPDLMSSINQLINQFQCHPRSQTQFVLR